MIRICIKHLCGLFLGVLVSAPRLKCAAMGFSKGLKNEFETVVVKESSGFEPLKFYCIMVIRLRGQRLARIQRHVGLNMHLETIV